MSTLKQWIAQLLVDKGVIDSFECIQNITFTPVAPYDNYDCSVRCKSIKDDVNCILESFSSTFVEEIDLIGNYFNIRFAKEGIAEQLLSIANDDAYGYVQVFKGKSIIVEHTSMTPVYPINLATFRSTIIGSSIFKTCSVMGAKVATHYFVEDTARQLKLLARGIQAVDITWDQKGKTDHSIGRIFTLTYLTSKGIAPDYEVVDSMYPFANKGIVMDKLSDDTCFEQAYLTNISKKCITGHVKTLEYASADVDVLDYESALLENVDYSIFSEPTEVQSMFCSNEIPYYIKNAIYYHTLKEKSDIVISVVPRRQREVIKTSLQALKNKNGINTIFFGDVVVSNKGRASIDSIREGVFNTVDQYITELSRKYSVSKQFAVDAMQYHILKTDNESTVLFESHIAESVRVLKNYSETISALISVEDADDSILSTDIAHNIIKEVFRFEDVTNKVVKRVSYAILVSYIESLKNLAIDAISQHKINKSLANAVIRILINSFNLLNIDIQKN